MLLGLCGAAARRCGHCNTPWLCGIGYPSFARLPWVVCQGQKDCRWRASSRYVTKLLFRLLLIFRADVVAFHAGTVEKGGDVVTSGGRVIAVSAYAPTLQGALDAAYLGVNNVQFEGKVFRRDIAHRLVV